MNKSKWHTWTANIAAVLLVVGYFTFGLWWPEGVWPKGEPYKPKPVPQLTQEEKQKWLEDMARECEIELNILRYRLANAKTEWDILELENEITVQSIVCESHSTVALDNKEG